MSRNSSPLTPRGFPAGKSPDQMTDLELANFWKANSRRHEADAKRLRACLGAAQDLLHREQPGSAATLIAKQLQPAGQTAQRPATR